MYVYNNDINSIYNRCTGDNAQHETLYYNLFGTYLIINSVISNKQKKDNKMKLTYWKIKNNDSEIFYSIRAKTKKEAIEQYKIQCSQGMKESYLEWGEVCAKVEKVVIEYDNAFDLVDQLLCENSADYYSEREYIIK